MKRWNEVKWGKDNKKKRSRCTWTRLSEKSMINKLGWLFSEKALLCTLSALSLLEWGLHFNGFCTNVLVVASVPERIHSINFNGLSLLICDLFSHALLWFSIFSIFLSKLFHLFLGSSGPHLSILLKKICVYLIRTCLLLVLFMTFHRYGSISPSIFIFTPFCFLFFIISIFFFPSSFFLLLLLVFSSSFCPCPFTLLLASNDLNGYFFIFIHHKNYTFQFNFFSLFYNLIVNCHFFSNREKILPNLDLNFLRWFAKM